MEISGAPCLPERADFRKTLALMVVLALMVLMVVERTILCRTISEERVASPLEGKRPPHAGQHCPAFAGDTEGIAEQVRLRREEAATFPASRRHGTNADGETELGLCRG